MGGAQSSAPKAMVSVQPSATDSSSSKSSVVVGASDGNESQLTTTRTPTSQSVVVAAGEHLTTQQSSTTETSKKAKPELSGWDLVQHKCRRKKKKFDDCWNSWYKGKFLTGAQLDRDCDDIFETWRECVLKQMKKERDRKGLGSPHKDSILGVLEDDNQEE